jgi:hypothetical protein
MDPRLVLVAVTYFILGCYALVFECRNFGRHEYYDRAEMLSKRIVSFLFGPFIIIISIVSATLENCIRMLQGKEGKR